MSPHRQLGDVTEQLGAHPSFDIEPPWGARDLVLGLLWVASILAVFALAYANTRRADAAVQAYYAGCMAERADAAPAGGARP